MDIKKVSDELDDISPTELCEVIRRLADEAWAKGNMELAADLHELSHKWELKL